MLKVNPICDAVHQQAWKEKKNSPAKNKADFSFYLITKSVPFEILEKVVHQAVEGGVTIVQLRAKDMEARQIVEQGKKLLSFLKPRGIPLIINDRVDIAHAIQADGVHLGQSDITVEAARAILGKDSIIGLSVETLEEALLAENQEVDYLAASPVFATSSKHNCNVPWGLDRLTELCSITCHPVIAIGGINHSNFEAVGNCGARGYALMSPIFDAQDPKQAAEHLSVQIKRSIRCK